MKTINVTFEDSEIELIERAKEVWKTKLNWSEVTWRQFIVLSAEEALGE